MQMMAPGEEAAVSPQASPTSTFLLPNVPPPPLAPAPGLTVSTSRLWVGSKPSSFKAQQAGPKEPGRGGALLLV